MKINLFIVIFSVFLCSALAGETKVPNARDFVLDLPDNIDLKEFTVFIAAIPIPRAHMYPRGTLKTPQCVIDVSNEKSLKAIIASLNYETVTIDIPQIELEPTMHRAVILKPQPPVRLHGRIKFPEPVNTAQFELWISYSPRGVKRFFNALEGFASLEAGVVRLKADGSFDTTVPDLAHDPVEGPQRRINCFDLGLVNYGDKTRYKLRRIGKMDPERADYEVPFSDHYDELNFEAIKEAPR
jgi:hypothetical protein